MFDDQYVVWRLELENEQPMPHITSVLLHTKYFYQRNICDTESLWIVPSNTMHKDWLLVNYSNAKPSPCFSKNHQLHRFPPTHWIKYQMLTASLARAIHVLVYMEVHALNIVPFSICQMMMNWCLMSSDVRWHIRDKLWPMPKHGSIILYVHGNQKAR